MAKSGMNPKVLQYLMGHSAIGVTLNIYTHLYPNKQEKIADGLNTLEREGIKNARVKKE